MSLSRQFWVVCHRWAGLTIALFLTIAGFTGIFLAWIDELEGAISPDLHLAAAPTAEIQPLDPLVLRQKVLLAYPGAIIGYTPLHVEDGRTVTYYLERQDPRTGETVGYSKDWDEVFVDPYTGAVRGTRMYGDITQGTVNLMPFLYRLHYSLALGEWGVLAFGIAALIWTLDSFVGFYLTLPVRIRRVGAAPAGGPGWWRRWRPSWAVRWSSSAYKLNFDLHRAGGLWIWPLLLVFAWSSVAFNLTQIYSPVMKAFGAEDLREGIPQRAKPLPVPPLNVEAARTLGLRHAKAFMVQHGGGPVAEDALLYNAATGTYAFRFTSNRDFTAHGGWSTVVFDAATSKFLAGELPAGQNGANTFTNWIMALHMGMVFGLPYRIAVSVIGALVMMLSITGVVIWMKKRTGRKGRKSRLPARRQVQLQPAE